jgi:hypothetical protein
MVSLVFKNLKLLYKRQMCLKEEKPNMHNLNLNPLNLGLTLANTVEIL